MTRYPSIYVDHETTFFSPEYGSSTPSAVLSTGLGLFLDRVSQIVAFPAGTVLLGGVAPQMLGFDGPKPVDFGARQGTPPLKAAADHGWRIASERAWMTATRKEKIRGRVTDRVIHLGIVPWLDHSTFPLWTDEGPQALLWRMFEWSRLLGVPYFGKEPGLSAMSIVRDECALRKEPRWQPVWDESCIPARQATEVADNWHANRLPDPARPYAHMYDMTTQHNSAAESVTVALDALQHRSTVKAADLGMSNLPGYYLVTIPEAWNLAGYLPHPAGRYRPGDTVWVAHPTLDLMVRCAETYKVLAMPEVHQAWVAPGGRVFREFSGRLSAALKEATLSYGPLDSCMVPALKQVYQSLTGLMETTDSRGRPRRIHRPDWAHAIKARARVLLWLKMYAEGSGATVTRDGQRVTGSGRWPTQVTADGIWYSSTTEEPEWPETFLRSDGSKVEPGRFVVKKLRKEPVS